MSAGDTPTSILASGAPSDDVSVAASKDNIDAIPELAPKKVGVIGLSAIVLSAMVGGGVFNLPSEMANNASAGSQIIAWIITGAGMWFIANTFRMLSRAVPNLKNGIFAYAYQGFGKLAGFFIAYGYWICNCFSQAAYGVLIMATMDFFLPGVFGEGNNLISIVCASALCWMVYLLLRQGVRFGASINIVGTIGKVLPILLFIVMMATVFNFSVFMEDFWGRTAGGEPLSFDIEAVGSQVSSTMLITLFLFVGIEGAVVLSDKAKSQRDVSRATTIGYLVVLALYVLVSLLPLGVYSSTEVAGMRNPSMAALMEARFGWVGASIVNMGIVISILSAWLVWVMMLAEMPFFAARDGIFPKAFARETANGDPTFSLLVTTCVCQALLILCYFVEGGVFQKMVSVTSVMAMPCYLVCCLFLLKLSVKDGISRESGVKRRSATATGVVGGVFALYLLYASGITYLMIACIIYAAGTPLFIVGRRQAGYEGPLSGMFRKREKLLVVIVVVLGVAGILYAVFFGLA